MKLNDTHLILLTTASQRENGSLLPLPQSLGAAPARADKSIAALVKAGLAEEGEVAQAADGWRNEGDTNIGVRITASGLGAIGIEPDSATASIEAQSPCKRPTKAELVLTLLQRNEGATLEELTSATGWLPHTTRAAMTGLRKKGHTVEKSKRGNTTCWLVKAA